MFSGVTADQVHILGKRIHSRFTMIMLPFRPDNQTQQAAQPDGQSLDSLDPNVTNLVRPSLPCRCFAIRNVRV
jgi:hypothetical protein